MVVDHEARRCDLTATTPPAVGIGRQMTVHETFELKLLQVFVHVCDLKSFTSAARRLGITPAAVTLQIDRLERTTGALFQRATESRSASRLTEAGSTLLPIARRLLAVDQEAHLAISPNAPVGSLRIGIGPGAGCPILSRAISSFGDRYGRVRLTVFESGEDVPADIELSRSCTGPHLDVEVLASEDTAWVAADARRFGATDVVLAHSGHLQKPVEQALERSRRRWTLRYDVRQKADVLAFIEHAGAIAAMPLSAVPVHLVVDRHASLPLLPRSQLLMRIVSQNKISAQAFARHIKAAF